MNILIDLCAKRSSIIEELAEKWQIDHDDAMLAWDLEQLCCEGAALCKLCRSMWDNARARLLEGKITDINGMGEVLLRVITSVLRSCDSFLRNATDLQQKGFAIKHVEDLQQEMTKLLATKETLLKKWPFIDAMAVARAREEYRRGEYVDSGELLHAKTSKSA